MKAQAPAEGILKNTDFGDSKFYQIVCGCGQEWHDHTLEVEADEMGVNVNIYASAKTNYWHELVKKRFDIDNPYWQEVDWFWKDLVNGLWTRIKVTWEIWTTGAVRVETTTVMSKQQALNYSETLKTAIKDVENFVNERKAKNDVSNKAASRLAEESDCV